MGSVSDELYEQIRREYGISEVKLKMWPEGEKQQLEESTEERRKAEDDL